MPQHHMVIPHYLTGQEKRDVLREDQGEVYQEIKKQSSFSTQSSFQDIPLFVPRVDSEQDRTACHPKLNGLDKTVLPFFRSRSNNEACFTETQMKDFVDDHDIECFQERKPEERVLQLKQNLSEKEWWEMQERDGNLVSTEEVGQVGPRTACRCQVGLVCSIQENGLRNFSAVFKLPFTVVLSKTKMEVIISLEKYYSYFPLSFTLFARESFYILLPLLLCRRNEAVVEMHP
jgi:hypothetical protein